MTSTEQATAAAPEAKPIPVFGSAASFQGTGFAGFTGVTSSSTPAAAPAEDGDGGEEGTGPEEECQAEFKPVIQLEEVDLGTGEEEEASLLELKCKLYRFDGDSNEWKERGIGHVRLLQHKENKRVRLLMRQEKTLKIRANHIVMPNTKLQEHSGSDKAWVWSTVDFSEEKQRVELFCMRFGSAEKAQEFKAKFEEAGALNAEVLTPSSPAAAPARRVDAEAEAAADELAADVEKKAVVEDGDEATSAPAAATP